MKLSRLPIVSAAVCGALVLLAGVASARNPHCAGGIQYVVGGLRDKDKGLTEDYLRQMNKAVQQLEQCAGEDTVDYEAIGYLAWAYAELDSAGPAGHAFEKAIAGLTSKGDKKKIDWAIQNRESYWSKNWNDGIAKINEAQQLFPNFPSEPKDDAEKAQKAEAKKRYDEAVVLLTRATLLKPNHPPTIRNLGTVYYLMGDFTTATAVFKEGLKVAPGDSSLTESLKSALSLHASRLIDDKKFDEAIGYFNELIKDDPKNADLNMGLASAIFSRAQSKTGDAAKADFVLAGDAYAKAAELKGTEADWHFNSALAYQNGGNYPKAEAEWRLALKLRPTDGIALAALGEALSEQKKFDEAVKVLWGALQADGKNAQLHRQLGAVYSKAGNNAKSTEELLIFLAMKGTIAPDPAAMAAGAKAGSAAAALVKSAGSPETIYSWEGDGQKYQSWFYWAKKQAYHFSADGAQSAKSDWGAMTAATAGKK